MRDVTRVVRERMKAHQARVDFLRKAQIERQRKARLAVDGFSLNRPDDENPQVV